MPPIPSALTERGGDQKRSRRLRRRTSPASRRRRAIRHRGARARPSTAVLPYESFRVRMQNAGLRTAIVHTGAVHAAAGMAECTRALAALCIVHRALCMLSAVPEVLTCSSAACSPRSPFWSSSRPARAPTDCPEELKARRERLMQSLGDGHDGHPLERPRAEVLARRRLRIPAGQRSALPDGRDAARNDARADAGEPHAAGDPVHPAARCTAGALEGHLLTPAEATAQTGIATVHETPAFDTLLLRR